MIKNFLKNKFINLINVLGFSLAIVISLLILCYVNYELSYESHLKDANNIYRVCYKRVLEKDSLKFASACPPLRNVLEATKGIESYCQLYKINQDYYFPSIKTSYSLTGFFASNNTCKILCNLKQGDASKVLHNRRSVVISEKIAKKIFKGKALGKKIIIGSKEFVVKGVFENIPRNSHIYFDVLISMLDYKGKINWFESWGASGFYAYVKKNSQKDPQKLINQINYITQKFTKQITKKYNIKYKFCLQPIKEIHLDSNLLHELKVNGSSRVVNYLIASVIFIILIALINYYNLIILSYLSKINEIAIRKVNGAKRINIIINLFKDSILLFSLITLICFSALEIILPFFYEYTGIPINSSFIYNNFYKILLIGFVLILIVNIYPVIIISKFNPSKILKGNFIFSSFGLKTRKFLVFIQIFISIIIISITIVAYLQYSYMVNNDHGFNFKNIYSIRINSFGKSNIVSFKNMIYELNQKKMIEGIAYSYELPGKRNVFNIGDVRLKDKIKEEGKNYRLMYVAYDFFKIFGIKTLYKIKTIDRNTVIINEAAARQFGFYNPKDAIGVEIFMINRIYKIVNIAQDYHFVSKHNPIDPQIYHLREDTGEGFYSLKLSKEGVKKIKLKQIKMMWKKYFPKKYVEIKNLEDYYLKQYNDDKRSCIILFVFSIISMLMTCLGVLGITIFSNKFKTKEICLRKINGASYYNIILVLTKDYLYFIIVSAIIAAPILYYTSKFWLSGYTYSISLPVYVYILPALLVLIIILLSIIKILYKSNKINPVKFLRYE